MYGNQLTTLTAKNHCEANMDISSPLTATSYYSTPPRGWRFGKFIGLPPKARSAMFFCCASFFCNPETKHLKHKMCTVLILLHLQSLTVCPWKLSLQKKFVSFYHKTSINAMHVGKFSSPASHGICHTSFPHQPSTFNQGSVKLSSVTSGLCSCWYIPTDGTKEQTIFLSLDKLVMNSMGESKMCESPWRSSQWPNNNYRFLD